MMINSVFVFPKSHTSHERPSITYNLCSHIGHGSQILPRATHKAVDIRKKKHIYRISYMYIDMSLIVGKSLMLSLYTKTSLSKICPISTSYFDLQEKLVKLRLGSPAHSADDSPCRRVWREAIHFFLLPIHFWGSRSPSSALLAGLTQVFPIDQVAMCGAPINF